MNLKMDFYFFVNNFLLHLVMMTIQAEQMVAPRAAPYPMTLKPPSSSPPSEPVTWSHHDWTTGTMQGPACVEDNIPRRLKTYNKIRKMKNWEDCRDACNADPQCNSFKHKVSREEMR